MEAPDLLEKLYFTHTQPNRLCIECVFGTTPWVRIAPPFVTPYPEKHCARYLWSPRPLLFAPAPVIYTFAPAKLGARTRYCAR